MEAWILPVLGWIVIIAFTVVLNWREWKSWKR